MKEGIKINFLGLRVLCCCEPLSRFGTVEGPWALELGILGLIPFVPPVELITLEGLMFPNVFAHW